MTGTFEFNGLLSKYVKRIVSVGCREYAAKQHDLRFFADGCPGLMFQESGTKMTINHTKELPSIFLYGQTILPIVLSTSGSYTMTVAFLYPDAVESLFGISARELTDTCVDLSLVKSARNFYLTGRMLEAGSDGQRVSIMEDYISHLAHEHSREPRRDLRHALGLIHQSNGNRRIDEVARELRISERSFYRHFEHHIGVAPKVYSSICRFQSALHRIQSGQFDSLSGLAYELGYADQSHFNRSFKRYTGQTPVAFHSNIGTDLEVAAHKFS